MDKVTSGERLKEPEFCPSNIYSIIMRRCWLEDPQERIKFEEARNSLISVCCFYEILSTINYELRTKDISSTFGNDYRSLRHLISALSF